MPAKAPRRIEFPFVLDALADVEIRTSVMFGCTSIYVGEQIVMVLRDKPGGDDNGVWLATTAEHHDSLRRELPSLHHITIFGPGPTGWQVLPAESSSFEREVLHACDLVVRRDPRIGKVPNSRKPKVMKAVLKKTAAKKAAPKKAKRS